MNTTNLSIKKILTPSQNDDISGINISKTDLPNESFTLDQANMVWRKFAHEVKSRGMETFYNAMIKRDPKLIDGYKFLMEVDNQVQINYITPHLNDLISYLRTSLKNYQISLEFVLTEDKESQVKFMTGKDRFASLAKKNANLHSFKTVFNLDIEY